MRFGYVAFIYYGQSQSEAKVMEICPGVWTDSYIIHEVTKVKTAQMLFYLRALSGLNWLNDSHVVLCNMTVFVFIATRTRTDREKTTATML